MGKPYFALLVKRAREEVRNKQRKEEKKTSGRCCTEGQNKDRTRGKRGNIHVESGLGGKREKRRKQQPIVPATDYVKRGQS